MPDKKWYLLLDDDTYIVRPSLSLLLDRLDPDEKHYIGNAIGGVYGRFAHGGSGVIISRGAMRHLLSPKNEKVITRYFNGERPITTKIRTDRFCAPIFSFHQHAQPEDMRATGNTFREINTTVRWLDVTSLPPFPL